MVKCKALPPSATLTSGLYAGRYTTQSALSADIYTYYLDHSVIHFSVVDTGKGEKDFIKHHVSVHIGDTAVISSGTKNAHILFASGKFTGLDVNLPGKETAIWESYWKTNQDALKAAGLVFWNVMNGVQMSLGAGDSHLLNFDATGGTHEDFTVPTGKCIYLTRAAQVDTGTATVRNLLTNHDYVIQDGVTVLQLPIASGTAVSLAFIARTNDKITFVMAEVTTPRVGNPASSAPQITAMRNLAPGR
jgi:hypothetical protein